MAKKKDKPPSPICAKTRGGLTPVSAYDAEQMDGFPLGTEFDLIARTKRSKRQFGTYWKSLNGVVKATGAWSDKEAVHRWVKFKLQRFEPILGPGGEVVGTTLDSTAMEAMDHAEFCEYMKQAMAVLSEEVGYDVLAWLNE